MTARFRLELIVDVAPITLDLQSRCGDDCLSGLLQDDFGSRIIRRLRSRSVCRGGTERRGGGQRPDDDRQKAEPERASSVSPMVLISLVSRVRSWQVLSP
jgi:hypothetical protein